MKDHPHNTGLDWIGSGEDQPKPTGEWTAKDVADIVATRKELPPMQTIAEAHNAAVKEAYQKGYDDALETR